MGCIFCRREQQPLSKERSKCQTRIFGRNNRPNGSSKEEEKDQGWNGGGEEGGSEEAGTMTEGVREERKTKEPEAPQEGAQETTPAETRMLPEGEQQEQQPPPENRSESEPQHSSSSSDSSSSSTNTEKEEQKEKPPAKEEDKPPADHEKDKKPPTKGEKGVEKIREKENETLPTNYETEGETTLAKDKKEESSPAKCEVWVRETKHKFESEPDEVMVHILHCVLVCTVCITYLYCVLYVQ